MKLLTIAMAIAVAAAFTGCSNMRCRTLPAKPCIANPCAVPAPCPPAKGMKTVEK